MMERGLKLARRMPWAVYPWYAARMARRVTSTAFKIGLESIQKRQILFQAPMITWLERNILKEGMIGRPPEHNVALGETLGYHADYIADAMVRAARDPDKFVWHEDLVAPEIIEAMGLTPFMVELQAILSPIVSPGDTHRYIDAMENAGFPGDICTLPKTTLGMILEDVFPPPRAILTSTSPCDGGMTYYLPIEQKTGAPVFRLDLPYNVHEDRALAYCRGEVERMIGFLEEVAGHRLDMDRLREVCEVRNRTLELTIELWDMMREKPAPLGGDVLFLSHAGYYTGPGTPLFHRAIERVVEAARALREQGRGPLPCEERRAILWNPPLAMYPGFYQWMEQKYNTAIVMDMLTYKRQSFIDTSSNDSMMRDITEIIAKGPMGRHTRGPAEYFFHDLFRIYEDYQADLIIMAAHLNCKNTRAVLGMFREQCRKMGIPLLIIDYDLSDDRVVSIEEIERQVDDFMDTVMVNF